MKTKVIDWIKSTTFRQQGSLQDQCDSPASTFGFCGSMKKMFFIPRNSISFFENWDLDWYSRSDINSNDNDKCA